MSEHPFTQRLRAAFVAGMLVTVPFGVTVGVLLFLVSRVDALQPWYLYGRPIPGLGLLLVTVAILSVGFATQNWLGNRLVVWSEGVLEKVPILNSIYRGVKQVVETALQEGSRSVKAVVLVEWPRKGAYSIAFLTGDAYLVGPDGDKMVNLFLPSTPNPTTGFYFVCPERDVIRTDLTVEDAAKLLMSAGLVGAPPPIHLADPAHAKLHEVVAPDDGPPPSAT